MSRFLEKISLIATDVIAVNAALYIVYLLSAGAPLEPDDFLLAALAMSGAWLIILPFFGVYRSKFAVSRTDELINIFKAVTFGTALLYFLLSIDPEGPNITLRMSILYYWAFLVFILGIGRIFVRTYQRKRLKRGIGHRKTLIIGTGKHAAEVYRRIQEHPVTGFDVKGFITIRNVVADGIPEEKVVGGMEAFNDFCASRQVEDAIIVLDRPTKKRLFEIVDQCNGYPVAMKTMADMYSIAIGNAGVYNHFGLQLVDILPERMSLIYSVLKRVMDIAVSSLVIFIFLPLWVVIGAAIKLNSKGPVFYRQERLGKDGDIFTIYKFRSMYEDAEKYTGPALTKTNDPRITRIGSFLRKYRLDEIPQFINVLEGDMSLIGPRPERPYFVKKFVKQIPLYSKRFRVKPGITGWAQVKQRFEESVKDVQTKLEYDLFYIENMSLLFDLKIVLATVYTVLARRGG